MNLNNIYGELIFALEGAKTVLELVTAALAAKKNLQGAFLRGADLHGAFLRGADLHGAFLRGADLHGASLQGAFLRGADLHGASLQGAFLRGADLHGASLQGAFLRGADLHGAFLRGADLQGADLHGASLHGASLQGAYLRGADGKKLKVEAMRVFSGLYRYEVWAVVLEDGSRWVRMGCLWHSLPEWDQIGIRESNISEFPNDGSEKCLERERAFDFAKDAAQRLVVRS